ncbi:MAG: aminotransferase class I/II-fold pyridoxal phosphate-dependent enzyme [Succinivibrionaceae bacterium]
MINSKFTNMLNKFKQEKSIKQEQQYVGKTASYKTTNASFSDHQLMQKIKTMRSLGKNFNIEDPFFKVHEHVKGVMTTVNGKNCINYSNYNYLGLNDHPKLREAAINAIREHGTSVGASRLVAGERPFQRQLEKKLAKLYHKDDAITFVSGHATNVSVISTLFGDKDLIIYDALDHNSIIQGIKLSGAKYYPYAHNDLFVLENILQNNRANYERVLIVTEGLFSMDGDIPNLLELLRIKKEYGCVLMIDEAHALGVLGTKGTGIAEHFNIDENEVDIWMGTLSKTLASCGGYIVANQDIVDILRYNAPGFVYSVGLSAPMAEAAITALDILEQEPERVLRLQNNSKLFLQLVKEQKINVGNAIGYAVIPVITGSSHKAIKLSAALFNEGINVQPIIHPAVEEKQARLRFFITSEHTSEQIRNTSDILVKVSKQEGVI